MDGSSVGWLNDFNHAKSRDFFCWQKSTEWIITSNFSPTVGGLKAVPSTMCTVRTDLLLWLCSLLLAFLSAADGVAGGAESIKSDSEEGSSVVLSVVRDSVKRYSRIWSLFSGKIPVHCVQRVWMPAALNQLMTIQTGDAAYQHSKTQILFLCRYQK